MPTSLDVETVRFRCHDDPAREYTEAPPVQTIVYLLTEHCVQPIRNAINLLHPLLE